MRSTGYFLLEACVAMLVLASVVGSLVNSLQTGVSSMQTVKNQGRSIILAEGIANEIRALWVENPGAIATDGSIVPLSNGSVPPLREYDPNPYLSFQAQYRAWPAPLTFVQVPVYPGVADVTVPTFSAIIFPGRAATDVLSSFPVTIPGELPIDCPEVPTFSRDVGTTTAFMTNNTQPPGNQVSASAIPGQAYRAFDKDLGTSWRANNPTTEWLQYEFPARILPQGVEFQPLSTGYPASWVFQASNDGATWENLVGRSGALEGMQFEALSPTASYSFFRLVIEQTGGGSDLEIKEMDILGVGLEILRYGKLAYTWPGFPQIDIPADTPTHVDEIATDTTTWPEIPGFIIPGIATGTFYPPGPDSELFFVEVTVQPPVSQTSPTEAATLTFLLYKRDR